MHTKRGLLKRFFPLLLLGINAVWLVPIVAQVKAPVANTVAQPLKFVHISSNDGLPQNSVLAIFQDATGFIWMGTDNGLARFDGYHFKVFRHRQNESNSLNSNVIRSIVSDPLRHLWIGTEGGGIAIMDCRREIFFRLTDGQDDLAALASAKVSRLIVDHEQNVWVATNGKGLFRIKVDFDKAGTPESYPEVMEVWQYHTGNSVLSDDKIWNVYEDKKGNLWVGTLDGGVYLLRPDRSEIEPVPLVLDGRKVRSVKSFFEDSQGNFWIGTEKYGLFQRPAGASEFFPFPLPERQRTFQQYELNITSFLEDQQGQLWIGTLGRGVYVYEPSRHAVFHFEDDPGDPYSLNGNSVYTQLKDNAGNIWLGMYSGEGLNKVSPAQQQFEHYRYDPELQRGLSGKMVKSIFKDQSDRLWIGLFNGGLNLLEKNATRFRYFTAGAGGMLGHNHVQMVFERSNGELWIGTDGGGITVFRPRDNTVNYWIHDPSDQYSLSKNEVWTIVEDKKGRLWIGTANGGGLNVFDPATDKFRHFTHRQEEFNSLLFNDVRALLVDSKNNLWIGTYGGGLSKMDLDTETFYHYAHGSARYPNVSNNIITAILEDKRGYIWVGTFGGGLNRINPLDDSIQVFREKDGLPSDIVKAILEDDQGQLWVSTIHGLSALDPIQLAFKNYLEEDGLQSNEFNLGAAFKDAEGRLYFGGINGVNAFFPDRIQPYPTPKAPVLTRLKVLNEEVNPGSGLFEEMELQEAVSFSDRLTFNSRQNSFEFEFSALEYLSQDKIRYAYQMEGYDQTWIEPGSGRRFANYANLPPGEYTFRMRAAYAGDPHFSPVREIQIAILPPWYRSNLAYLAYVLLLLGLAYTVKSVVSLRIRLKNDLRFERLEKEKQEEVSQMKLRFFTNISHELRTPLMLIISPLEQLLRKGNVPPELSHQLDAINLNAGRLLRLINQLLDFRKQEAGHLKLSIQKVPAPAFLEEIKQAFDGIAAQRRITYELDLQPDIPEFLWIDPHQMEKVFFNLIYNAFKFTPEGGTILVRAATTTFLPDGEKTPVPATCFCVSDTGKGIPQDQLNLIFERFFQVNEPGGYHNAGTGIGLALSKNLVDFHRGKITVTSVPNQETVFSVYLRQGFGHYEKYELVSDQGQHVEQEWVMSETAKQRFLAPQRSYARQSPGQGALPPRKILLVEDNPELLALLASAFESEFQVFTATNGREGLTCLSTEKIDCVISDVMMPEMDGIEFCARVKGQLQTSHIPLILLTARSSYPHQLEGYESGADDYIPKPFRLDLLVLKANNLLNTRLRLQSKFLKSPHLETPEVHTGALDQKFLADAIAVVEANIANEHFAVKDLVKALGLSRTLVFEKFKSLIGQPPNEFIQTLRLKKAARMIRENKLKINEIAYQVGFSDPKYFSKSFQKQFGVSPSRFKANLDRKIPGVPN
ncbi:MAG: response regulator [Saprospiraceae bacterium]|nr:response regulator [Saprospiraceae bacterium]